MYYAAQPLHEISFALIERDGSDDTLVVRVFVDLPSSFFAYKNSKRSEEVWAVARNAADQGAAVIPSLQLTSASHFQPQTIGNSVQFGFDIGADQDNVKQLETEIKAAVALRLFEAFASHEPT